MNKEERKIEQMKEKVRARNSFFTPRHNFKKEINNLVTNKKEEELVKIIGKKFDKFIDRLKEEDNDFYDDKIRDQDLDQHEIVGECFKFFNEKIDKFGEGK